MKGFLKNYTLRESCFDCKFKNFKVNSDITLGDYWGIQYIHNDNEKLLDNKGVSLVMINTIKGKKLFNETQKYIYLKETDITEASKWNTAIIKSVDKPSNYDNFWNMIDYKKVEVTLDEYTK